ncbi:MAG TPA: hypothetical protein VLF61_02780, partial [Rhabdochlamydiaceae bacterium]|nr:hypothetical protein [Rhabdochlamydiaceae bacterium]
MNWVVFLSLGALLSFSPMGHTEEGEDSYDEDFSIENEELLVVEDDETAEEIEQEEEVVEEERDSIPVHSEMALKKMKTKPSKELIEETPPKVRPAQKEAVPKIKAQAIEKISVENDESPALQMDESLQESEPLAGGVGAAIKSKIPTIQINMEQVFGGAPIIYTILAVLSTVAFAIWSYTMFTVRSSELLPQQLLRDLKSKLISNQFTDALMLCQKERHFFCKMVATGILARKQGLGIMVEMMKAEGKRSTV